MYGFEAGGYGVATGHHAAPLTAGVPGILHGSRSYLVQDDHGRILGTHSVSAGLDYPGVGPEHSYWHDQQRVHYRAVDDEAALAAFRDLTRLEGIMPALETAHALAGAREVAAELGPEASLVVSLSGRGDKDIHTVAEMEGEG
jgi:tryptophan synthase beta chain